MEKTTLIFCYSLLVTHLYSPSYLFWDSVPLSKELKQIETVLGFRLQLLLIPMPTPYHRLISRVVPSASIFPYRSLLRSNRKFFCHWYQKFIPFHRICELIVDQIADLCSSRGPYHSFDDFFSSYRYIKYIALYLMKIWNKFWDIPWLSPGNLKMERSLNQISHEPWTQNFQDYNYRKIFKYPEHRKTSQ